MISRNNTTLKILLFSLFIFHCSLFICFAQTADDSTTGDSVATETSTAAEVEGLLDQKTVTCTQAAYFVLATALEQPPQDADEAFSLAIERGWLPAQAQSGDTVTMGSLSLLVMKAFDFKGGFMYRITKNQRYAYREMIDRGFITGRAYSSLAVSGEQFLQILGNVASEVEETQ